jgi:hypothetical protein
MPKIIEIYKVVSPTKKSALDRLLPKKYKVEYKVGEWVEPVKGKLFAFTNLVKAQMWVNQMDGNHQIYSAFGVPSRIQPKKVIWNHWSELDETQLNALWSGDKSKVCNKTAPLSATIFCDKIMIVKRIV